MDKNKFKKIRTRIKNYKKFIIRVQSELSAIPALSPENGGEGEVKKAEYIKNLLSKLPYDSFEEINAPDDRVPEGYRPNFIFKINGKSSEKTIWIMSHMDIVPPGDLNLWETDPYKVVEKDGKLYGRGTEDNHQGIVSSIIAVKALRDEKIIPEYDVGLIFVSDEECGSKYGIDYVLEKRSDIFRPQDLIIVPDAGDPEGITIEIAEKSILWVKCEIEGKQTHGSTPEKGINAHKAAANLIVMMNGLYEQFPEKDPLFDPPISTFEPTRKEENVPNINTIPGKDVSYFDFRILPTYKIEQIEEKIKTYGDEIEKRFGVKVKFSFPQRFKAPPSTPTDSEVVEALKSAIRDVVEKEPKIVGIGGGTVAASFRKAGLPAVCWCTQDDTLHAPNEYCKIDNLINDASVFAHVFLQK